MVGKFIMFRTIRHSVGFRTLSMHKTYTYRSGWSPCLAFRFTVLCTVNCNNKEPPCMAVNLLIFFAYCLTAIDFFLEI